MEGVRKYLDSTWTFQLPVLFLEALAIENFENHQTTPVEPEGVIPTDAFLLVWTSNANALATNLQLSGPPPRCLRSRCVNRCHHRVLKLCWDLGGVFGMWLGDGKLASLVVPVGSKATSDTFLRYF